MTQLEATLQPRLEALPEARRTILQALKRAGSASAGSLAAELSLTREATRQQLLLLQQQGLIANRSQNQPGAGRPSLLFFLTENGEQLFPKNYDQLALLLLDTISEELGDAQLNKLMAAISERQVAQWQQQLHSLSIKDKLLALKDIYFANDPYTQVLEDKSGLWLIEQNCPYLNLAMQRPSLCSITVSTLTRLLGVKVKREKRFQDGDGQCAFRILKDQPVAKDWCFALEET